MQKMFKESEIDSLLRVLSPVDQVLLIKRGSDGSQGGVAVRRVEPIAKFVSADTPAKAIARMQYLVEVDDPDSPSTMTRVRKAMGLS